MKVLNRLRKVRKKSGLSLEQLSALSGISKSEISDIELGRKIPSQMTIILLSDSLDIPAHHIFIFSFKHKNVSFSGKL